MSKKSQKENRSNCISVRMTDTELHQIKARAEYYCITISEYLRTVGLRKRLIQPKIKQIDVNSMHEVKKQGGLIKLELGKLRDALRELNHTIAVNGSTQHIQMDEILNTSIANQTLATMNQLVQQIIEEYKD